MSKVSAALVGLLAAITFNADGCWAATDSSKTYVVFHPTYDFKGCTLRNAQNASLKDVVHNIKSYKRKCVRITGLQRADAIYSSISGYYLVAPASVSHSIDARSVKDDNVIGLYLPEKLTGKQFLSGAATTTVIGRVGTCDDLNGPNVIMIVGYCHHGPGDVFIAVTYMHSKPARFIRLIGESVRQTVGNLREVSPDWPLKPLVEEVAQRWLASIQNNGFATFRRLALGAQDPNESDADLAAIVSGPGPYHDAEQYVFFDKSSSFAQFRGAKTNPELVLFRYTDSVAEPKAQLEFQAIACFCRKDDCSNLWPISDFDAANAPQRPYICAEIWRYNADEAVDTLIDAEGALEP